MYKFKITNHIGEELPLDLYNPDGFLIASVSGLSPTKANVNMANVATGDGAELTSVLLTARNIVFSVVFQDETKTVEELRRELYRYFVPKKQIKIEVETNSRSVFTYGYAESIETNMFTSVATAQISVLCPNAFFYATGAIQIPFLGAQPQLEFPFANESVVSELIEMSSISDSGRQEIIYTGDVGTGFVMEFTCAGPVEDLKIISSTTRQQMEIDDSKIEGIAGSKLALGDVLIISTIQGAKYLRLIKNNVVYNVLNALKPESDWIELEIGLNILTYRVSTGASNIEGQITYDIKYAGV